MKIGAKHVGDGHPVYVIAEVGANHGGSLTRALDYVRCAAHVGADAVKFQLFDPEGLYPGRFTPGSIEPWWIPDLRDACRVEGIEFLCSVFDLESLRVYVECGPAAVKIASPEASNETLLRAAVGTGLPLIVSTGAMGWKELDKAIRLRTPYELVLLHCVSAYPVTDESELNLRAIRAMTRRYGGVPVGYSDHSMMRPTVPYAVAAGACMIEKHLTLDHTAEGPDQCVSIEPDEFREMVAFIRGIERALGDGVKRVMPSEDPTDRR